MEAKKEDIRIYGKLVNVTTENVVADAEQIWDSNFQTDQASVNQSIRNDFDAFKKHPEFDNASFIGDVTFKGNVTANKGLTVNGESNFYDTINAHGNPNSIIADHKITTNDLEVSGTFSAINLDVTNLTVHGLLKVENGGELRIDGDSTFNNVTINGNFVAPHATTQKYGIVRLAESKDDSDAGDVVTIGILNDAIGNALPNGKEGDVLVYKNGKWQADSVLEETIQNITNKFDELKQELLNSQYWELNSDNEVTPKENRNVRAAHFYKSAE
jgi:hypothetical protein